MPGLIDAHVHAYACDVSVQKIDSAGEPYRTAHAMRMLGHALDCGFTTVRDIGGGDYSLWRAIEDRLIRAPRFFYAGKILSMTGGHGDFRQMTESRHNHGYCSCGDFNSVCVVADGVDECIKAVREELRRGAHCIKIMGSGGVASPTDPIWMNQYREDEIRAIVNETTERRTYTSAHCHPASAIRRCVEFGVRCIEHGTLIDDETARFVAERGAYVVPTMVIIFALVELGKKLGFPPESQEKAEIAFKPGADRAWTSMRKAGVQARSRHGPARRDLRAAMPRVHDPPRGVHAGRDPAPGDVDQRRDADAAGPARLRRSRARTPTCSSSTATRSHDIELLGGERTQPAPDRARRRARQERAPLNVRP